MKKLWFLLVLTIAVPLVKAQSFTYTFIDPCTGNSSIVQVPIDPNKNITVSYYKQVNTFNSNDFNNGVFSQWVDDVFSKYQGKSPCAGIGTVVTNEISQGTSFSVIGILNSLSAVASNSAGGAVSTTSSIGVAGSSSSGSNSGAGKSGSKGDKKSDKQVDVKSDDKGSGSGGGSQGQSGSGGNSSGGSNQPNQGNSEGNGGSGTAGGNEGNSGSPSNPNPQGGSSDNSGSGGSGSGGSGSGGNGGSGGSGSGGNGGSGGEGSGETPPDQTETPEEKKTDFTTGNNNAVRNTPSGGGNDKKGGGSAGSNAQKPTIIGSSDFVGISGNSDDNSSNLGLKVNGGYTSTRWDGMTSHGVMVDYTSTINGPNITGFYAWIGDKAITLAANTVTIGFEGKGSIYNTVAFGQLRNVKSMKVVYLVSATAGQIYKENFLGTSAIFGGMYDYQMNKRIAIKFTALGVYAPFVRYYADAVLSSPFVILPSIGTNLALSKSFIINVNAGGAYSFENKVLNYTITSGLRMAIGT